GAMLGLGEVQVPASEVEVPQAVVNRGEQADVRDLLALVMSPGFDDERLRFVEPAEVAQDAAEVLAGVADGVSPGGRRLTPDDLQVGPEDRFGLLQPSHAMVELGKRDGRRGALNVAAAIELVCSLDEPHAGIEGAAAEQRDAGSPHE